MLLFPLPRRALYALVTLLLSACDGGGDGVGSPPPPATLLSGVFVDAPVAGLSFATATVSGQTDGNGVFQYSAGEEVRFFSGPLILGRAEGGALITPMDVVPASSGYTDDRVAAVASFLQSGDQDANLANGIQLKPGFGEIVCDTLGVAELDVSALKDIAELDAAVQTAALAEGVSYVAPATAADNLSGTLMALMEQTPRFDEHWGVAGVFTGAVECADCHQARDGEAEMRVPEGDASGEDVSPPTEWKHSIMAHAFDDPYFQAVLQEESVHEFPDFKGLIEDRCLTCHSPMGRTHAVKSAAGLDVDGYYRIDQALLDQHAREGVSCSLCHQVAATDVDDSGNPVAGDETFSGNYVIDDSRIIYGPYTGPRLGPMQIRLAYMPSYGHQITVSSHCASCHTVRTPVMDVNTGKPKVPARDFLEQSPYLEWQNSVFDGADPAQRRECQDCHMPVPGDDYQTAIALPPPDNLAQRQPFFQHRLYGGNTHLLTLLKTFKTVLGIDSVVTDAGFDDKIADTRTFLSENSATVAIDAVAVAGGNLEVDVTVTNNTGHKMPSAYPSRRAWLHFAVKDGAGTRFFESGAPGPDGRISIDAVASADVCLRSDKPADFTNSGCVEPHRNTITDSAQVAVYESVLADTNDHVTHVLLYADHYLKDNRLPPRGFRQGDATPGTEVVLGGVTDADFNAENAVGGSGADTVHYRVPVAGRTGPFTVEVRFLYQSIRPSFVAGLHSNAGRVSRFKTMYQMVSPLVESLGSDSLVY